MYLPYDPVLLPLDMLKDVECIVVQHIEEVVQHLEGQERLSFQVQSPPMGNLPENLDSYPKDFLHVIGHEQAKRAFEIAEAGEHHLLMS